MSRVLHLAMTPGSLLPNSGATSSMKTVFSIGKRVYRRVSWGMRVNLPDFFLPTIIPRRPCRQRLVAVAFGALLDPARQSIYLLL
jgi:hypothetical protein